jgi:transcriptional regulator with XRE-family HTH domain
MDWPALIKAARLRLGETQTQFAKGFGVAPNTVSRWETGAYEVSLEAINWLLESMDKKPMLCPRCAGTGLVAAKARKRAA